MRVCQALALPVVAEGIEHEEVADLLSRVGCGHGQGWLFGRPEAEGSFRSRLSPAVPGMRTCEDSPVLS